MENIQAILSHFALESNLKEAIPMISGHINTTYLVLLDNGSKYTLQAINTYVFPEPIKVMDNITMVTRHLREKILAQGGDAERECLTVILTKDGLPLCRHDDGTYWRLYGYIDDVRSYDVIENPVQMYHAGRGYGRFQKMLSDIDMSKLHETIPDFHNTKKRFQALF